MKKSTYIPLSITLIYCLFTYVSVECYYDILLLKIINIPYLVFMFVSFIIGYNLGVFVFVLEVFFIWYFLYKWFELRQS